MKRLLDLALAGPALVLSAPLVAALAVAVKLDSRGPALFVQTRVGRDRRPFRLFKLRTMADTPVGGAPQVTSARDPRITRVGALLRRAKLDELPQLWNVVRGDMSIVGPRPEVPRYVERYRPEWRPLLAHRPGLTDRASIAFRDEERLLAAARDRERAYTEVVMPLKLQLALEGVTDGSVLDDLKVIAHTVRAILRPTADHPTVHEALRRIAELDGDER